MFSLSLRCLALLDASFRDIRVGEYGQSLLFLSSSPTHFRLCPLFSPTPQCIYFADRKMPVQDGLFSSPETPTTSVQVHASLKQPRAHRRHQASTGAKRRCEPWYQPWGVTGARF